MRIEIKVDGNDPDGDVMILTDEVLNNDNFVDLLIGDESYTVPFWELESAILAFRNIREHNRTPSL